MKMILLMIGLWLSAVPADASCVGGFDGTEGNMFGCSELGDLGDLAYERNAQGVVMKKRTDAEIKAYVADFVKDRFKNRGVKVNAEDIKVRAETVDFDLLNQNGDKIYSFSLSKDGGIPKNEEALMESRKAVDAKKAAQKNDALKRIEKLKKIETQIKADQTMKGKK